MDELRNTNAAVTQIMKWIWGKQMSLKLLSSKNGMYNLAVWACVHHETCSLIQLEQKITSTKLWAYFSAND